MPDVTGITVDEAKKTLNEIGLEVEINGEGEMITDQLPKKGIRINSGSKVNIYTN